MKSLLTLLLLFCWILISGQNLVPNSGFEDFDSCPDETGQLERATPWINPNSKSPDLYNRCAGSDCETLPFVCVPNNWSGTQEPFLGNGYAGIFVGGGNVNREYIQIGLSSPLAAGQSYELTYYLSLGDSHEHAIDNMGVYFSTTAILDNVQLDFSPQISSPDGLFLTDKVGWMKITDTLIAAGGEAFMSIGNFNMETNTDFIDGLGGGKFSAYYYIDEISLTPIKQEIQIQGDTLICLGESTILSASSASSYEWLALSNSNVILSTQPTLEVAPMTTTSYRVSSPFVSATITVYVEEPPRIDLGKDTTICQQEPLNLDLYQENTTFLWQDNSNSSNYTIFEEGTYWVQLENECGFASDTLQVDLGKCQCAIYVPNAFSPNNDGVNDFFSPFYACNFDSYKLIIFTRWGEKVFETTDRTLAWDGRFRGKELSIGMYVYQLQYTSKHTKETLETGFFTLIR